MRVTVRLFARLRDIAGAAELAREVAPGATIAQRLARSWPADFPSWRRTSGRSRRRSTPTTRAWISALRDGRRSGVPAAGLRADSDARCGVHARGGNLRTGLSDLIPCSTSWPPSSSGTTSCCSGSARAEVQSDPSAVPQAREGAGGDRADSSSGSASTRTVVHDVARDRGAGRVGRRRHARARAARSSSRSPRGATRSSRELKLLLSRRIRTTRRTSCSRSAPAPAATRRRCSPPSCSGCTASTPSGRAGGSS